MKHTIYFEPDGIKGHVDDGQTILDAARDLGIDLNAVCGGKKLCGKCKVEVKKGRNNLSPPGDNESNALGDELHSGYRLACSAMIRGPVSVSIPEGMSSETIILTEGDELLHHLDPVISKDYIHNDKEVIDIISSRGDETYGVAVDIGTTTVVAYLMNLTTGKMIAIGTMTNPQVVYGSDVISRIAYCLEGEENKQKMSRCLRDCLNHIISSVCKHSNINSNSLHEITVAGNTAMHHFLLGLNVECLSKAPFTPALHLPCNRKAGDLDLNISADANIHILPVIDGFVGADTVGVIISTQPHLSQGLTLVIDIGTNGEIVAGSRDLGLVCCSAAAGPAFEGGHIKFGMRAAQGAIEQVRIDQDTFDVDYRTIGDTPPRGICGSGIIDAVAQMIKCGIIQKNGRINTDIPGPRLLMGKEGPSFVLEWAEKTAIGRDLVIVQDDIREIQLAKAALHAGADILLKHLDEQKIQRILLAGAFGNYIDKESAMTIGMFPPCRSEDIVSVGNAAGQGARMALLSRAKREEAAEIARTIQYLELSNDPDFERTFVKATYFP
jgi:uncharacterized 2Fe-2S/4Fe-4S cluster protein (DUF4445 family)